MKDSRWLWDNFREISKSTANSSVKNIFLVNFLNISVFSIQLKIIIFDRVAHTKIVAKKTQLELH